MLGEFSCRDLCPITEIATDKVLTKSDRLSLHSVNIAPYCAQNCLMTMVTLIKYNFNSRPNLEKLLGNYMFKVLMYLPI